MKASPWAFTMKIVTLYSRSTITNAIHKHYQTLLPRPLLQETKHLTHRKKSVPPVFIASNTHLHHFKPPITATMTFSTSINTFENQNFDMSYGISKKAKLRAPP
jgi:hypothetical protein